MTNEEAGWYRQKLAVTEFNKLYERGQAVRHDKKRNGAGSKGLLGYTESEAYLDDGQAVVLVYIPVPSLSTTWALDEFEVVKGSVYED